MTTLPTTIIHFSLSRGEDRPLLDPIYDADGVSPTNVTDWTGVFVVCKYNDSSVVFISKSFTPVVPVGSVVNYPSALQVQLDAADTLAMDAPQQYSHYWQRTDAGNNILVSEGLFSLMAPGGVQ